MTSKDSRETSGVFVIVDCHSHLPPALEVAIALADRRRLPLHGLLVEDPDLASVSSLPFSQEVTLLNARPRALEQERLRRTLRRFDRRFRALLSQGAERASLEYSFSSVMGRRQAMEQSNSDYLVLGQPRPHHEPARKTLRVLLIGANMEAALPVLESLLPGDEKRQLELILIDGTMDPAQEVRLQDFVALHPEVSCQRLPNRQLVGILRPASQAPDLLIASRQCSPELLETLLKLAACPVILSA